MTTSRTAEEVLGLMGEMAATDAEAISGIGFGRRFFPGAQVTAVAREAYGLFANTTRASPYPGLPSAPSMLRMQGDVEKWALDLLDAPPETAIRFTSGGTESVILAVHACRKSSDKKVDGPLEIVAPYSAHPCIDKAAELLGLKLIRVPVGADYCADLSAMAAAITPRTIMLYASFPSYAYGLNDDVAALGTLAQKHGLWLHVDACMSGFLAPFMRMNGVNIPPCSLSVPGVTSISADFHKHGYSAKGVSAVLMPHEAADRSAFSYSDHPLPTMTTPSLAGTAAGAPIASAWAVIQYLGTDGFCDLARELHESTSAFRSAIASVDGFHVLGDPTFSILVVASDRYDIREVHRLMSDRNWFTLLVRDPAGLHLNVGAKDGAIAARFAADLRAVTENIVQ